MFSFEYNDRPVDDDLMYEYHSLWMRVFGRVYHRVEHRGFVNESVALGKEQTLLFISNHAILIEAGFLGCVLLVKGAGKLTTLIYPEAFRVPLFREFFRSAQCAPVSVENGAAALKKRHVLIFPEGMDFISGFVNPDRVPAFHKGFLRIAKRYLETSGRESVHVVPVAHAGLEKALKLGVVRNRLIVERLLKKFINYPYLVYPKFPFLFPTKVVFRWGVPMRLTLDDLSTESRIRKKMIDFRSSLLDLRLHADRERLAV